MMEWAVQLHCAGVGWRVIGVFSVGTFSGVFDLESVHPATESTNNKQRIMPRVFKGFMIISTP